MTGQNNTNTQCTVWAFVHVSHEDLGSFEHVLRDYGIAPRIFLAGDSDIECLDPAEPDLLIVMGGPMGVYEADRYPFLHHEIRFVERRIALGKPVLGICLGAQIMAAALGARVYRGTVGREIGWRPVSVNAAGMRTPLRYLDRTECTCVHWHGDTFDLPRGAELLASSELYPHQAFRLGDCALALQFHPEVTEAKLERWYARLIDDIRESGQTVDGLRAQAARMGDTLRQCNRLFFVEWLENVAPSLLAHRHKPLVEAMPDTMPDAVVDAN